METVSIELNINENLCVEFSGEPVTVNESFGHAFGIEKKVGVTVKNITWDKENLNETDNSYIMVWLLQDRNLDKVTELLIDQYHKL